MVGADALVEAGLEPALVQVHAGVAVQEEAWGTPEGGEGGDVFWKKFHTP